MRGGIGSMTDLLIFFQMGEWIGTAAFAVSGAMVAIDKRTDIFGVILLAVITLGIWFTAVYTSHHYIIDVSLGILCALLGTLLFEGVLMRIPAFSRFISRYARYIALRAA